MAVQISGRLTLASEEQPSFEGCRGQAALDERLARAARSPSAYSDVEGRFTVIFPDHDELPGESVQFVALSPTGRRIGAKSSRLATSHDITIEVEPFDPAPPEETISPEHAAVKGIFENGQDLPAHHHREPSATSS